MRIDWIKPGCLVFQGSFHFGRDSGHAAIPAWRKQSLAARFAHYLAANLIAVQSRAACQDSSEFVGSDTLRGRAAQDLIDQPGHSTGPLALQPGHQSEIRIAGKKLISANTG